MTGLEIIGAGFGRTGTSSLKVALEYLGYPTYHMQDAKQLQHDSYWIAAERGEFVNWDDIFQGYSATLDWPSIKYYKELLTKYPNAKVILSTRDPERWYESAYNTIYFPHRKTSLKILEWFSPKYRLHQEMLRTVLWRGTFHGRFGDKQYALTVFENHNEEVKRVVPPDQLLIFDPREGWEPLCNFLEKPVPQIPFPHVNDSLAFKSAMDKRITVRNRLLTSISIFPIIIFVLFRWYSLGRFPLSSIMERLKSLLKI
ncbi:hypothetical protein K7432_015951 [Basidiobolus ranarum]|uniref:Sulfotransferase family protein n=1 Tax=Basidiobolus ranarum TaxID=34480 RepID=A0ABR2WFF9_9FUNG